MQNDLPPWWKKLQIVIPVITGIIAAATTLVVTFWPAGQDEPVLLGDTTKVVETATPGQTKVNVAEAFAADKADSVIGLNTGPDQGSWKWFGEDLLLPAAVRRPRGNGRDDPRDLRRRG